MRRCWSVSGDVLKRTVALGGERGAALPLPLSTVLARRGCVESSHSSCRTSSRRLMDLRAFQSEHQGGARRNAPDEVELDDGTPGGAFTAKVLGRERELEVCTVTMSICAHIVTGTHS